MGLGVTIKDASEDESGFLRLSGRIMRTGLLEYGGSDPIDGIVYRSKAEIEKALPSFQLRIVTDDHPDEMVDLDNVKSLDVGHIGEVFRWVTVEGDPEEYVEVDFLITDATAIQKIKDNKVELSVGLLAEVHDSPGRYNGASYQYEQRNLKGNHIAIVDEGRAGPSARLITDEAMNEVEIELGGELMKIPEAAAQYIAELEKQLEELKAGAAQPPQAAPAATDQPPAGVAPSAPSAPVAAPPNLVPHRDEKLEAERDALKAQLEAEQAGREAAIRDRLDLERRCVMVGMDSKALVSKTSSDLRHAVILAAFPALKDKLEGKSEAYIAGLYDSATAKLDADAEGEGEVLFSEIADAMRPNGAATIGGLIDQIADRVAK